MSDLGPGPRRWQRAQEAYDAAVAQRNADITKALKQGLASAHVIAKAYGVTRAYVYRIALAHEKSGTDHHDGPAPQSQAGRSLSDDPVQGGMA